MMGPKRTQNVKTNADDRQRKISTFFQNGASKNESKSKLFSTIDQQSNNSCNSASSKEKKIHSSLINDQNLPYDNYSRQKEVEGAAIIFNSTPKSLGSGKDQVAVCSKVLTDNSNVKSHCSAQGNPSGCHDPPSSGIISLKMDKSLENKPEINKESPDCLVVGDEPNSDESHISCLISSTPVKCSPPKTISSPLDSSDIIFDTPDANVKKGLHFNRSVFATAHLRNNDRQKMTRQLSHDTGLTSKLSAETVNLHPFKDKLPSDPDSEHHHKELSIDIPNKEICVSPLDRGTSLKIMDTETHIDVQHAQNTPNNFNQDVKISLISKEIKCEKKNLTNKSPSSQEASVNIVKPVRHTLIKSRYGEERKKLYRTSSDSKLLNALKQSERNDKEKEIQQQLTERLMTTAGRNDLYPEPNMLSLTSLGVQKSLDSPHIGGKGQLKTQSLSTYSIKCNKWSTSTVHDVDHGKVSIVTEDDIPDHIISQQTIGKSNLEEKPRKKQKKFIPKFSEICHKTPKDRDNKQEASLKNDCVFEQLMKKLSPASSGKDKYTKSAKISCKRKTAIECGPSDRVTDVSSDEGQGQLKENLMSLVDEMLAKSSPVDVCEPNMALVSMEGDNGVDVITVTDSPQDEFSDPHQKVEFDQKAIISDMRPERTKRKLATNSASFLSPKRKKSTQIEDCIIIEDERAFEDDSDSVSVSNSNVLDEWEDMGISLGIPFEHNELSTSTSNSPLSAAESLKNPMVTSSMEEVKAPEKSKPDDCDNFKVTKNKSPGSDGSSPTDHASPFVSEDVVIQDSHTKADDLSIYFDNFDDSLLLAAASLSAPSDSIQPPSTVDTPLHSKINHSDQSRDIRFVNLWQRFIVKSVHEDSGQGEKLLGLVMPHQTNVSHYCILKGFWEETKVYEDDIVNVLGTFEDGRCVLTDTSGFLIVNPDVLMSGTSVVSSVFCMRKSVLNEFVKSQDVSNIHMLYGRFLHSLFQVTLKDSLTEKDKIMSEAKTILSSTKLLHEMYSNSISESKVWEEVNEYIPSLVSWVTQHTDTRHGHGRQFGKSQPGDDLVVTDVQDIEENIWSPRLGLKGKIDLTVKVRSRGAKEERILPLELKTGRASFSAEHKGQVILYSMMYGDRREEPGEGILLYLKHGQMEVVQGKPQSQSGLIQLRNSMASFISHQVEELDSQYEESAFKLGSLPQPLNSERACSKCPHLRTCCLYQKSVEKISHPEGHAMAALCQDSLNHLTQTDLDYFQHWALCLALENHKSSKKKQKEIWTLSSKEREKNGDCLSSLVIVSSELGVPETQGFTDGKGCSLTFIRHQSHTSSNLDIVGLNVNDHVVVSSEDGRLIAFATGFIRNISASHVEVVVDRDNLYNTSSFKDIMFRLDRNDSFSTHGILMANISRIMDSTPHSAKLRHVIIGKNAPNFDMKMPMSWVKRIKPVFKDLNKPQKMAILKVLMSKDFVLIRGFPGSGKTSTIVALVKVLQILGLSTLLTSYTHSAVDNILLKLKRDGVNFLRLGRQSRIHAGILPHSAEILTTKLKSVQELTDFYASFNIVATSCLGMNHPLFIRRRFDVCIVDEASQVLQPACLGPLFFCDKFVLVGDGKQLPPLVQSYEARRLGMDESLFTRLENSGAVYDLNLQYRMNKIIMALSNQLVYDGKLQCGSPDVAHRSLVFDKSLLKDCPPWIREALHSDLERAVTFIDTEKANTDMNGGCKGVQNEVEAVVVMELLHCLLKVHITQADIGVISPYRSQIQLLQCHQEGYPCLNGIEINTIDQYQGRDKSVIIVSFVYNGTNGGGELLQDLRRLNVALTRAQKKLIMVGSMRALQSLGHMNSLLACLEKSNNIVVYSSDHAHEKDRDKF